MIAIPANLRINADDFGILPSVTRAIADAVRTGYVNSISVTPFTDTETETQLRELATQPELSIGAHLTFLEVPLLTRPAAFPDGPPRNYRAFLHAYTLGKIKSETVYQEWRAQVLLLRGRIEDRKFSHLDSHQHVHLLPGLWPVIRRLQDEFGIPRVRVPWEGTLRAACKDPPFGLALQSLAWLRRKSASEKFFGVGTSMNFSERAFHAFAQKVAHRPEQNFELMIHPDTSVRGQKEIAELRSWLELLAEEIERRH